VLDSVAIAQARGFMRAMMNGPPCWGLDEIIVNNQPAKADSIVSNSGDITMRLVAMVELAVPCAGGIASYSPNIEDRDTVFQYFSGRRVYQLSLPQGKPYLMQSIDTDQGVDELRNIGARLLLAVGWQVEARVLDRF
jgi:hypothetical protein